MSLILLDRDNGVASREEQGHLAEREPRLYEYNVRPCCWGAGVGELRPPRIWMLCTHSREARSQHLKEDGNSQFTWAHVPVTLCRFTNAWLQSPEFRLGSGNPCLACSTLTSTSERREGSWGHTISHTGILRRRSGKNWTYLLNTINLKVHQTVSKVQSRSGSATPSMATLWSRNRDPHS